MGPMTPLEQSDEYADFYLTASGILQVRLKPTNTHNYEAAVKGVATVKELGGGIMRPLLVDLSRVHTISNEARQYYAEQTYLFATRCALLSTSVVGKMIANFFLSINKPRCPTRMFNNETEALAWLQASQGDVAKSA